MTHYLASLKRCPAGATGKAIAAPELLPQMRPTLAPNADLACINGLLNLFLGFSPIDAAPRLLYVAKGAATLSLGVPSVSVIRLGAQRR